MNETMHLYHLQLIDHQLDRIEKRLSELTALLESSQEIQQAQIILRSSQVKTKTAAEYLSGLEIAAENQRIKIELDERALYGGRIHNPKELTDLQNEVNSLKKHKLTLEEEIIRAMIALEEAEKELQQSNQNLTETTARSIENKSSLSGEMDALHKQKEKLLIERSAAENCVTKDLIEVYSELRKKKRGTAVSLIMDGGCSACGSTLTPAEQQSARSPVAISNCSSCGRILYAG